MVNSIFSSDRFYASSGLISEDISYSFILKRGSSYYMNNLLACFILNAIIVVAFYLPFPVQVTLSMTTFLTYAVQSLNIAGFLPVQSQYYPLISIYFLMSLICTFSSLVWFWYTNKLLTENKIPSSLRVVANYVKKCLFFIFIPSVTNQEIFERKITPENDLTITNLDKANVSKETEQKEINKCNNCELLCSKCIHKKQIDEDKRKEKENNESLIKALNILASFTVFSIFLIIHICIWTICAINNE